MTDKPESCPVCGEPVVIAGKGAKHYESVAQRRIQELEQRIEEIKIAKMNAVENELQEAFEQGISYAKAHQNCHDKQSLAEHDAKVREEVAEDCAEICRVLEFGTSAEEEIRRRFRLEW